MKRGSGITFVLQGPIFLKNGVNVTKESSESIRRYFPESKIILSTWADQDVSEIVSDKTILNERPINWKLASSESKASSQANNVNRQILSSKAGLQKVETDFAVKIRSDLVFTSNRLSKLLNKIDSAHEGKFGVFNKRVIILDRISIDPRKVMKLAFNPCDYFSAGETQDVLKLWSREFVSPDEALYFEGNRKTRETPSLYLPSGLLARYTPEAHIWTDLFKSKGIRLPEDYSDTRPEVIESSIQTFLSNIIPLGQAHIGLDSPKHPRGFDLARTSYCYTYLDWKRDLKAQDLKSTFSTFHSDIILLWAWEKLTKVWRFISGPKRAWG